MPETKAISVLLLFVSAAALCGGAESASSTGHWVSSWCTAVHAPLPFPGLPPFPIFENQTVRMVVRPTIVGRSSVSIPPGAPILSDPVDMTVRPFTEIAVSVYVPKKTPSSTIHLWAQHEAYTFGPGDYSGSRIAPDIGNGWNQARVGREFPARTFGRYGASISLTLRQDSFSSVIFSSEMRR